MLTVLVALVTGAGLAILVYALGPLLPLSSSEAPIDERITAYGVQGRSVPDELEGRSFQERVVDPQLARIRAYIASRTPDARSRAIEGRLELAGRPYGLTAPDFAVARVVLAVAGFTAGLLLGLLVGGIGTIVLLAALLAIGAYLAPGVWLAREVASRRDAIQNALPSVLDLLVVAVDAGLTFDSALSRVIDKLDSPLTRELALVQRETALGRPRNEALQAMAERVQAEDIQRFVNALMQADQLGVPIARALRAQATEARRLAGQRIARKAAEAPVRMVIPMIIFILPTIWLILLGPALISVFSAGL